MSESAGEQACVYAALILHDDNVEITAEKLATLVKAANVEAESIWFSLFAKALASKNLDDLLMNVGSGAAAPAASAAAPAAGGAAAAPAAEEKPQEKEESDEDMGFGLFD